MTTFEEREKGYEAQLAHDEELKFRAYVRRNRLLGLWAAAKLGKSGQAAEDYASELVTAQIGGSGDEAVFARLRTDFAAAGIGISDHQIHREMSELLAKATLEVAGGGAR